MPIRFTPKEGQKPLPPLLKFALEIGPLIVFFLTNNRFDLFTATAAFMIVMGIAMITHYILAKHLPIMPLVSGVMVFVFGGLTLYLQDETFIKIKPTIMNIMFAVILLIGYIFKRYFLELLLGETLKLQQEGWKKLTINWGIFFLVLAVLNEYIWRNYSTDIWVNFKTFGIMPITFLFSISQIFVVKNYLIEDKSTTKDQ